MNTLQIKELLQKRNLKATSIRLNLISKLSESHSSMSYSAIQESLKPIDRVTLYRTLESLKEKGIIHKAFQDKKESFYAMCGSTCEEDQHRHEHVHFKCNQCNVISCEQLKQVIKLSLPGFSIAKTAINLEGTCKNCL